MSQRPSIGRIVIFRSRTGAYDVPAMISATTDSLNPAGAEAYQRSLDASDDGRSISERYDDGDLKGVPPLSSDTHVHLTVMTPGIPGQRGKAEDFLSPPNSGIIGENSGGVYQEFDVPFDAVRDAEVPPGTWRWPARV